MKETYFETIRLIERLHRQFLEVVKVELDRTGVVDINNIQALILSNIGKKELTVGELTNRGYYLGSNVSYNVKKMVEHGYDDVAFIEELAGSDRSLRELANDVGMSLSDARNVACRLRVSAPVKAGEPSFKACLSCGAREGIKACGRCKAVFFCNAECQKRAWPGHKAACQAAVPRMPKKPEPPPPAPEAAGGGELQPVSTAPDTPASPDAEATGSGIEFKVAGTWTLRAARMAEAPTMAVLDAFNWPKPLQCLTEALLKIKTRAHQSRRGGGEGSHHGRRTD